MLSKLTSGGDCLPHRGVSKDELWSSRYPKIKGVRILQEETGNGSINRADFCFGSDRRPPLCQVLPGISAE